MFGLVYSLPEGYIYFKKYPLSLVQAEKELIIFLKMLPHPVNVEYHASSSIFPCWYLSFEDLKAECVATFLF